MSIKAGAISKVAITSTTSPTHMINPHLIALFIVVLLLKKGMHCRVNLLTPSGSVNNRRDEDQKSQPYFRRCHASTFLKSFCCSGISFSVPGGQLKSSAM
jgi:hypothetical protein